ncbi:F-box [Glarea lozoyensis ATCC 20868]|uniref:F-box n=1 Tax=Glarea lozoyensis (strain ATCC 20868 / MF5171) TaxID=1116229 RepID=S3CQ48_GLAL2|nr:F-box [Glarea lozoyensis ATCC 20868]EPE27810.1 F-box [Glarea lozoyensis ATCC 20868]
MDDLPTELVVQIISYVPKTSLPQLRLVSRLFNNLSIVYVFSHIPQWLDYEASHRLVLTIAHDAYNRPAAMWSPWATAPDEPCDNIFLGIVWKVLVGTNVPGSNREVVALTAWNFAALSGREDMDEKRLRTGQNRFWMHRSYAKGIEEVSTKPCIGVVKSVEMVGMLEVDCMDSGS